MAQNEAKEKTVLEKGEAFRLKGWKEVGLKKIRVLAILILLSVSSALASLPQTIIDVEAQELVKGNISFMPNVIPQTCVSFNDSRFVFDWLGNHFEVAMFTSGEGFEFEFEVEEHKTKLKVKVGDAEFEEEVESEVVVEKFGSNVTWGMNVWDIPSRISDYVESLAFKIVNTNFTEEHIELEEIETFELGYNITRAHLPDNLVLSYEDLFEYDFTVSTGKFEAKVEGVKGKTEWHLDPITLSGRIITVTGYTESVPCNFKDLWEADKAGTQILLLTTSAGNHTLTTQVNPANNKSITLEIVASDLTASGWCNITGTEKDDSSQTENIAISANTTYSTSEYWKTVTYINCSGIWNIMVQQGQWGVVWKTDDTQFMFDARIVIGDGTTSTWFADTNKHLTFTTASSGNHLICIKNQAHFRLGNRVDSVEKRGVNGVDVLYTGSADLLDFILCSSGADVEIYGSKISSPNIKTTINNLQDNAKIYDSTFENVRVYGCSLDMNYVSFFMETANTYAISNTEGTMSNIHIYNSTYGLYFLWSEPSYTVSNVIIKNVDFSIVFYNRTNDDYIINGNIDWIFGWLGTSSNKVYNQYEYDFTFTYQNGTAYQGANVTITYEGQGGGQIGSWLTWANGSIPTQTISRSFYNQTGGDTEYAYYPYVLTVTADGMETYTKKWTPTEKTAWEIALTPNKSPIARFSFTPSDPETNEDITFNASDSVDRDGSIATYSWTFGDGTTASTATHTKSYSTAGTYTVTLTVTDNDGATDSFAQTISVSSPVSEGVGGAGTWQPVPPSLPEPSEAVSNITFTVTSYPRSATFKPWETTFTVKITVKNEGSQTETVTLTFLLANQSAYTYWRGNRTFTLQQSKEKEVTLNVPTPNEDSPFYLWIQLTQPTVSAPMYVGFMTQSFQSWLTLPFILGTFATLALIGSGYGVHRKRRSNKRGKPRREWYERKRKEPTLWE